MAIHEIDVNGNIVWKCPHIPEGSEQSCGSEYGHHISHEHIQWHGRLGTPIEQHTVSLPPCSACGAQTFLKVSFSDKELRAPNMWTAWQGRHDEILLALRKAHNESEEGQQKEVLLGQIATLERLKADGGEHTASHAMAQRHIEFARQLRVSGKHPTEQGKGG